MRIRYHAVVVGASSGGMNALNVVFSRIKQNLRVPVIIVQHRHPESTDFFMQYAQTACRLSVKEAEANEPILPGLVYFAPPDYHVLIEYDHTFSLCVSEKVNYARPSIDVLFESAADVYRAHLVGIILTGANCDGSLGLKYIKEHRGLAIVQKPATAEAARMPRAALHATTVDHILSLEDIGEFLNHL